MMGWEGYARNRHQAALPHIALSAPAHTLKRLADLEPYLAKM